MARGLSSFADGLLTGYMEGKKLQQQREENELRLAKLRDDKAMAEEMKQARANMEPVQGFEVVTPNGGRATFADEAAAKEAATSMEGASVRPKFLVGDQSFDSEDQAEAAAETFNSPAAKARRQMETALKYNRPDLARQHQDAWKAMVDATRYDAKQRFLDARTTGDLDAVQTVMNNLMRTQGRQIELSEDGQGNIVQRWIQNGQVAGERVLPADQFWDAAEQRLDQTPDNTFEYIKFREGVRRDRRDADLAERKFGLDAANTQNMIANRDAGTAQGAQGLSLRQQELEFNRQRQLNPAPDAVNTIDPATGMGQVTYTGVRGQYAPGRGLTWTPREPATVPLPGQPMSTYNTLNRPQSGGLLGMDGMPGQQPLQIDWSAIPPRNPPAAQPQPNPTAPPPGAVRDENGNWTAGNRAGGLITR